tara:strand:+ start:4683 stop:5651 length:969 start_codon:yes stop_codon:yes gene_type:complete
MERAMSQDIIADAGYLFIATRMKRLADRMQADALKIFERNGFGEVTPAHMPVLYALSQKDGQSIGELVQQMGISQPAVTRTVTGMAREGFVTLEVAAADQRQKVIRLAPRGRALLTLLIRTGWPDITAAAEDLCTEVGGDVLGQLDALEAALAQKPLTERGGDAHDLQIVDFTDELAEDFYRLNAEWIVDMFAMEKADEEVLKDPKNFIIDRGGHILFVRAADGEIIGAGALQPVGDDGDYELTKMGVDARRRGEKAGEFLLAALIQRARQIGVEKLHLLTNKKCEPAIHLYEKLGFYHSDEVMKRFAAKYERANVAMRYPI